MAELKYSIPKNYMIQNNGALKGLVRRGKNGDTWLWEPVYKILIVSKTFGKIMVAHLSAMPAAGQEEEEYLTISSYNKEVALPGKVYDVLFGENVLYVKMVRRSTGEIEWCKVNEDLQGGIFLGEFEFIGRDRNMHFHIPVGTEEMLIKINGENKRLLIHTGEIKDPEIPKMVRKQAEEEVVTHYNVLVNPDTKTLQLLHPTRNSLIKQSNGVGEIEAYAEIINTILGGMENVPKERAEKLLEFINEFEHFGNAIILPILYEYIRLRKPGTNDEILDSMLKELKSDWVKVGRYSIKTYTSVSIIVALVKTEGAKITVAPYMIKGEDGILEVKEVEGLINCFKSTGVKYNNLKIRDAVIDETIEDADEIRSWPSPYSVRQRPSVAADIREFTYDIVNVIYVDANIMGKDNNNYGKIQFHVAVCDKFSYVSKKKISGRTGDWVTTNVCHAQIV